MPSADSGQLGQASLREVLADASFADGITEHGAFGTYRLLSIGEIGNTRQTAKGRGSEGSESAAAQRELWDNDHVMHGHSRIRCDAKTLFHPLWTHRGARAGEGEAEGRIRASRGVSGSCALFCSGRRAFDNCGLTSILHIFTMQDTAHADTSRIVLEVARDQAGAPRTGVGLQPSAPLAVEDGTDGADAALYRCDRGRVPTTLGRERPSIRPVRPGRGGSVAAIAAGQV